MKNRYFLEIAFNGSYYHGWQMQANAVTVQSVMNLHLSVLLGEKIMCHGCGRTDSGVHAERYMLHFDTESILESSFLKKLDRFLPTDIQAKVLYKNPEKIHARFDALRRSYRYVISKGKNPFTINLATPSYINLDIELLKKTAEIVKEFNDFEAFSKGKNNHKHYLCTIFDASWEDKGRFLEFNITANRFVRAMIRMMVGTMADVGRKRISMEEFRNIIQSKDRQKAGKVFPADGLYFTDVEYPAGKLIPVE